MKNQRQSLPVPPAVESGEKSMEMIRVWVVDGHQEIVLTPHMWKDPGAWGILLVDIAKHVAKAYSIQGADGDIALKNIRSAFDAEWHHPTE